jgi:hypothetical protein
MAERPILAPEGESPACASHPDQELDGRYNIYEHNPAPWWVALYWIAFLVFGAAYLVVNLVQ